MSRPFVLCAVALLLALPIVAQTPCNLDMSMQLEESQNYRSNVGFAELTGNPVDLVVSAVIPESKVSPSVPVHLDPNQFVQLGHVLNSFGFPPNVYNARITVRVAGGAGRATAYGSVIDNVTNDPTYVPAQQ